MVTAERLVPWSNPTVIVCANRYCFSRSSVSDPLRDHLTSHLKLLFNMDPTKILLSVVGLALVKYLDFEDEGTLSYARSKFCHVYIWCFLAVGWYFYSLLLPAT